ncbi:hypothetical protein [Bdellovibrio sp. HCB209]|uniref:hypothetical protein n=1 Tax=Bdellovibrio sp. HCB209 TaxID=3394354 RepID=UPI0039B6B051
MKAQRYYALDLLRSCAILVVTFYHVWESSFGDDKMLFSAGESVFGLLTPFFLNYWGYSGIILAIVSFFLIGHSHKNLNWQRYLLVTVGLLGMAAHDQTDISDVHTWSWNLYAYLLISLLAVQFIPKNRKVLIGLSVLSIFILLIPIEMYQSLKEGLNPFAQQMLIGDLDVNTTIGWGLLPWLAIPLLGFCTGRIIRDTLKESWVFHGFKNEHWILLGAAALLVAIFPMNPDINISRTGFYYYVFSGSLWFFWSRFLVIAIWIRLSCLTVVNEYLGQFSWMRFISDLAWNKYFGLCYFVQFAFIPWASEWSNHFRDQPRLIDLYWVGLLLTTELCARLIVFSFKNIKLSANKFAGRA